MTEAGEAFDDVVEIRDGSLFLELFYFSPVGLRNVLGTGELIVTLGKLELTQEASLLKVAFLEGFVLLVDHVLDLGLEFSLHRSDLRRNDVSEHLVHHWYFCKLVGWGPIELDEILLVWYFDVAMSWNCLEEDFLGFVSGQG